MSQKPSTQAPAVNVVRTLAAERGREATASEEANAERFVKKLFERFDLSIPVEVEARGACFSRWHHQVDYHISCYATVLGQVHA